MDNNNPISDEQARQITEALNRAARSSGSAMRDLGTSSSKSSFSAEKAADGLENIGQGAIQFGQALLSGKDGLDKYGSSVDQAASGMGDLLMSIGPIGAVFGVLVKVVGAIIGTVLKTDQKLLDGYDKLADIGGAAGLTTASLRELANQAEYASTSEQFPKLIDIIHNMGGDLLALGKTASDGMKKFADIAKVGETTRGEFMKLGLTQDKLTQLQAGYIQNQVKTGTFQTKNQNTLREESINYATKLVETAALTGQKIDKIKQDQDEDLKSLDFLLAIRKLEQEGNNKQAEKLKFFLSRFGEQFGPENRKNLREAISSLVNNGVVMGEGANSLALSLTLGGESLQNLLENVRKGTMSEDQFILAYKKATNATMENFGKVLTTVEGAGKTLSINTEGIAGLSKENADGQAARTKKDVDDAKKRADPLKQSQIDLKNTATELSRAFDTFIGFISNFVNKGFQALMYGFKMLAKGFVKLLDSSLFRVLGYEADNSVTYMFDSADELITQLKDTTKGIADAKTTIAAEKAKKTGYNAQAVLMAEDKIKNLSKTEKDIREVLGRMLDTKDVDKAITERQQQKNQEAKRAEIENRKPEQNVAPASTASIPVLPAIEIGVGTKPVDNQTSTPTQSRKAGGLTSDPYSAIGPIPSDYNAKIPLPSGVSIPATVKLPADMTSTRRSLLTDTDDINSILSSYMDVLSNSMNGITDTVVNPNKTKSVTSNMLEVFANKMDSLLDKMNENTNLQNDLLVFSKR